ncbi:cupin domain-containing protein [Cupriavidus sp. 2TAF22]|uniref:cupin domain-containing protein n=1 Tax=unclassified Cupriavidus TaxID=2640874 RepID=UPI003F8E5DC8
MEHDAFTSALARDGFQEVTTVTREPNGSMPVHTHPFEARALILEGVLYLAIGGEERAYRAGDTFQLQANEAHAERYGPDGVRFLIGRKPAPGHQAG